MSKNKKTYNSTENSGQFKTGHTPWSKGKKYKCPKNSATKLQMYKDKKNHPMYGKYKENSKQYYSNVHKWLIRHFGKAKCCENIKCKKISKTFQWANISGEYKRERSDYIGLCVSCHQKADRNGGIIGSNVIHCRRE